MPSPFPGMDPYLEDPAHWPDVHGRLIYAIDEILNRSLGPKYISRTEERVYILDEPYNRLFVPDIRISPRSDQPFDAFTPPGPKSVEVAEPIEEVVPDKVRERFIKIVDRDSMAVVTVIEVTSPANKVAGRGRKSYVKKIRDVLQSNTNFVEIDLLRAGNPYKVRIPSSDYTVRVVRQPSSRKVWPIKLRQQLPIIPIPLNAGDGDFPLNLQDAFSTAYDRGKFEYTDYQKPAIPSLPPEYLDWADALLREKGVRK